jgi:hypothetical protein
VSLLTDRSFSTSSVIYCFLTFLCFPALESFICLQTGSGKTYTMLGEISDLDVRPSPDRGMIPHIFEFLFARIRAVTHRFLFFSLDNGLIASV